MINGQKSGTIKTDNIVEFVKKTYPSVAYEVEGNEVSLNVSLAQSVAIGLGLKK